MPKIKEIAKTKASYVDWTSPTKNDDGETTYPVKAVNPEHFIKRSGDQQQQSEIARFQEDKNGKSWKYVTHPTTDGKCGIDSVIYFSRKGQCLEALNKAIGEQGYYLDKSAAPQ